ncbi:MAG: zinc ABC transporter substrate-binding protein [Treponema sp.]|jgi:zinc transport system substrate-binding protein|nr:zinc ABC transporter substrate-binding protein [Treponema sp.]
MYKRYLAVIFSLLVLISCSRQITQSDKLMIAVSIQSQAWFVSQIAGDKVEIIKLLDSSQNPHNYEPGPKQIQSLSSAGAWILSGTEFEIGLRPKISALFPKLLLVDGTEGVNFRYLEEHEDGDRNRSELEIDRHTWLGREPAKILAAHICKTLIFMDSGNAAFYSQRYENLLSEIDTEFDLLMIDLAPLKGKAVFVYHPSFGYFLDEFDIHQEAVESGGKEPGPRVLNNLIKKAKEDQAAAIIVQTQFPVNAAKTIADVLDIGLIELDPFAEDWLGNIRHMGQTLRRTVK